MFTWSWSVLINVTGDVRFINRNYEILYKENLSVNSEVDTGDCGDDCAGECGDELIGERGPLRSSFFFI